MPGCLEYVERLAHQHGLPTLEFLAGWVKGERFGLLEEDVETDFIRLVEFACAGRILRIEKVGVEGCKEVDPPSHLQGLLDLFQGDWQNWVRVVHLNMEPFTVVKFDDTPKGFRAFRKELRTLGLLSPADERAWATFLRSR
jgi:hypothetical protein